MLLNFYRTLSLALAFSYGAQAISLQTNDCLTDSYVSEEVHSLAQTYGTAFEGETEAGGALKVLTEAMAEANKLNA